MKHITSIALLVSLVGCGDNGAPDPVADPTSNPTPMAFPASCMDAGNGGPVADGEYTLYIGGDEDKPWKAYCHGGDEFLTVNDYTNFGRYVAGGHAVGTDVETTYTKLRIDPQTLTIDISDQTFATSVGTLDRRTDHITSMPVGVAMACAWSAAHSTANIDLLNTPFRIVSQFAVQGTGFGPSAPGGGASLDRNGQWLETWAYGECGYVAPVGMSDTPINQLADGWQLKVEWFVPTP